MPHLTELENVLGCVSTAISPRTGLGAAPVALERSGSRHKLGCGEKKLER
jgi:hypothetical protein